jgi:possible PTS enzyme II glucose-specific factor IIABC component (fragment)
MAKTNKSGTMIYYVPDFLYVYTYSYEMSLTQRISEEIPRTKQVGEEDRGQ